jgi:catechol 2,3-dioxygenase
MSLSWWRQCGLRVQEVTDVVSRASNDGREGVRFRPRRLAHGNFFVTNLEVSTAFYVDVCGLNLVYREPGIHATFLSNGSSHHDAALMEVSAAARIGRDGQVQVPAGRGHTAGLNHLAFEMESEAQLVAACQRAKAAQVPLHRTADHQISHSVYLFDPDGNYLEMYWDTTKDWRAVYRASEAELLTGTWDPDATSPSEQRNYNAEPEYSTVPGALLHPKRSSRATLLTADVHGLRKFYVDVIGLDVVAAVLDREYAVLAGTLGGPDLALLSAHDRPKGLHHFGFELEGEAELEDAIVRLRSRDILVLAEVDNATKHSVAIADPDGIVLDFFVERAVPLSMYSPEAEEPLEFLL